MKKFILLLALHSSLFILCRAQYSILLNFNGTNGAGPTTTALTLSGSVMYGMTQAGGSYNGGVIFSIDTNGNKYKDLFNFSINSNFAFASPSGSLTLAGKLLYGMTENSGIYNAGCIFTIDTNGNGYKDLFDFNGTNNGGGPYGNSLTLSGSKLFGMTTYGGAYNPGCIFSIDTNGNGYKVLYSFNTTNGAHPEGSLTLSGNMMYGMTLQGGANGEGCVFSIDSDGTGYKKLLDFNGINGEYPMGDLTLSGSILYGMTSGGGAYQGNIFSINTNGSGYKDLLNFNGTNGAYPYGSLTFSGGVLYGMVLGGGAHGSIFSIDTNGYGYKDLFNFNGTNGANPLGSLTLMGSVFYGMTTYGGANGDGVVFKIDTTNIGSSINVLKATTEAINVYPNPNNGSFTLVISGQWVVGSEMRVEVYNVLGERVFNQLVISNEQLVINISGQPNGVYFYRVVTESGGLVGEGKVVIEK